MTTIRPDVAGLSPLAKPISTMRTPPERTAEVFGVVVHSTGSGIVSKALAAGRDPFADTCAYYANPGTDYYAHYTINYDGQIAQVADERRKASHVGWSQEARQAFLDGSWTRTLPPPFVTAWRARWPRYASPAHLFPGTSVNQVYCVVPETRVLDAGYQWVPIGGLEPGRELVGFNEDLSSHLKLSPSRMVSRVNVQRPCLRIITDAGEITCSRDHRLVVGAGRIGAGHGPIAVPRWRKTSEWKRAEDLRTGDGLRFYLDPWTERSSYSAGWLAGIIDGEGHWNRKGELVVTQNPGVVADQIVRVIRKLGWEANVNPRRRPGGCLSISIAGAGTGLAVVGALRPVRMLGKIQGQWEGRRIHGHKTRRPKILAIEDVGQQWVVAMETTSSTYISEGFLSHNCGVELLPWQAGCDGVPSDVGLRYTRPQHHAVAALCQDIANRWGFPAGWSRTGRLCGHEDLNPLERVSGGRGWDPGIIRPGALPWINWGLIVSELERPVVG